MTRSLKVGSGLAMAPLAGPLAPSVFSDTFGTCCLNTRGVIFRGLRTRPVPLPGPHCRAGPVNTKSSNTWASSTFQEAVVAIVCVRVTLIKPKGGLPLVVISADPSREHLTRRAPPCAISMRAVRPQVGGVQKDLNPQRQSSTNNTAKTRRKSDSIAHQS